MFENTKKLLSLLLVLVVLLAACTFGGCSGSENTKPEYDDQGKLLEPDYYGKVKLGDYKGLAVTETIVTASEKALEISMDYEKDIHPELSDEELKAFCEQKLKDEMAQLGKNDAVAELVNQAIENSKFKLNETAVEYHFQERMEYYQDMADVYNMTIEEFAANIVKNPDNFEQEIMLFASQTVKLVLLAEEIVNTEGIPYDSSLTGDDAKSEKIELAKEFIYRNALIDRIVI